MDTLVLTVIGDDRPGLVSALSARLSAHGAGWERSQMSRLAGKFAGIVEVLVPPDRVDALVEALDRLEPLLDLLEARTGWVIEPASTGSAPPPDALVITVEAIRAGEPATRFALAVSPGRAAARSRRPCRARPPRSGDRPTAWPGRRAHATPRTGTRPRTRPRHRPPPPP